MQSISVTLRNAFFIFLLFKLHPVIYVFIRGI